MSEPEHVSEIWQSNTDRMILMCRGCNKEVQSWDIAREDVTVPDITAAWDSHTGVTS